MVVVQSELIGRQYAAPVTFEHWIANYPEDKVTELLNGELVTFPYPGDRHQGGVDGAWVSVCDDRKVARSGGGVVRPERAAFGI